MRGRRDKDLEEGVSLKVFGAPWSRTQPLVRVFHQKLLQQVLGSVSNHRGEGWITAQNTSERGEGGCDIQIHRLLLLIKAQHRLCIWFYELEESCGLLL